MIKLYSFAVNRPDFLFYQYRTFKHFLTDEFEFIVINDGHNDDRMRIQRQADLLKLPCHVVVNPRRDTANYGHARSIQYAYETFIKHDNDISVMLDGDMFLARKYSIREWLGDAQLAGLKQGREHIEYLWPGIVFMDMGKLPEKDTLSFWPDLVEGVGVDVGGHSYEYIKAHPEIKVKWMTTGGQITEGNRNIQEKLPPEMIPVYDSEFHIEVFMNAWVHYACGTNWYYRTEDYHRRKSDFVFALLENTMNGSVSLPQSVEVI